MLQELTSHAGDRSSIARSRASDAGPYLTLLASPSLLAWLQPALLGMTGVVATSVPPQTGTYWRFETDGGAPINLPATAIRAWERPPFSMLIRLVPSMPSQAEGQAQGQIWNQSHGQEAVIGTRVGLAALQAKIVQTMLTLLHAAKPRHARSELAATGPRGPTRGAQRNAGFIGGAIRHAVHRMRDRVLVEEWAIGLVHQQVEALLADEPLAPARWLSREPGVNLADPHPRIGSDDVLCEAFGVDPAPESGHGRIICLKLDRQETIIASRVILADDMHHSYPGSLQCGEDVVFLPETPARGATELYRLRADDRLEKLCSVGPLLRMADPTLFKHEGRFWIAYTDLDMGEHDNLCLLHAPALVGPWTPHQANPVKIDIRSARPGGPVIALAGCLYRPAQNCAASYGASLVINQIRQLTPEQFSEVVVREITPSARGPYPHGLHTFAVRGDSVLIDGKRQVFRSGILLSKLRRRVRSQLERTCSTSPAMKAAA